MHKRLLTVACTLLAVVATGASWADAAGLTAIKEARALTVCANPDALPFSSQDPAQPGFQLELARALARELGVELHVNWIVYTRHARQAQCDAVMGAIVPRRDAAPAKGPRPQLSRPYASSGYLLVLAAATPDVSQLDKVTGGKIGVEHSSWPHYMLSNQKIAVSSYGGQSEILDAVASGEVAAGLVTGPYLGWYLKQHPGAVKPASAPIQDPDLRWNVAMRLYSADQPFIDAVNAFIDRLLGTGTIEPIFARYGIRYQAPLTE
jgi:polar amino acid transport system substrate-binding protein